MSYKWFRPLKRAPVMRDFVTFDIEGCGGDNGFVCGAICGGALQNFFTDKKEMLFTLIDYGINRKWIFSHNLEYDLPILAGDYFWDMDCVFTQSTMLWAELTMGDNKIRFYDSANLFPRWSVKTLGDMVGKPKLKIPDTLMAKLSKGQSWWTLDMFERLETEQYCRRDAEIIYYAISLLQDTTLSLGGQLQPTIAGISMDVYRRKFHKWEWQSVGEKTNELARKAFYGGRVENFAMGKISNVNMYDITSLYPYIQSTVQFPHPNHLKMEIEPTLTGSWWNWEGVAEVTLHMPEIHIPVLPYRFVNRLFFPVGDLTGQWSIMELKHAIAFGARIQKVHWVLGSPITFNPFNEFVEQLFHERSGYLAANAPQANIIKLILNSLYGRFGLNPDAGLFKVVPINCELDFKQLQGYSTYNMGSHLIAYGPISDLKQPTYVNTLFAAQITSAARLYLYKFLAQQASDVIYCDTDSIITRNTLQTGEGLGQWRQEMYKGTADLLGPKEYQLHNDVLGTKSVVKGVPNYIADEYMKTGVARFMRALTIREAIQKGYNPSEWVEVWKSRTDIIPKRLPISSRSYELQGWTWTRPYLHSELNQTLKHQTGFHRFPSSVINSRFAPEAALSELRNRHRRSKHH